MRVPQGPNANRAFFQSLQNAKPTAPVAAVEQSLRTQNPVVTPQSHCHGPVSQVINSKYLFELRKDTRKVIRGRKLKGILNHDYSLEEFDELPASLRNLIAFDRTITTAEILQFMEAFDKSHEITFRDYNFDRIKFRALFEALGDLVDVEMQAGPSTFISLDENFEIKKKIKEIFVDLKNTIKDKLVFKKAQSNANDDEQRNTESI